MNEQITQVSNYFDRIVPYFIEYGPKLAGAIIVLIIGFWIIKLLSKAFVRLMEKRNLDPSLITFLKSMVSWMLKVLIIISVMGMVGIEMTSFIAIIGAAGLAVGLALSGTLQNFAGGVILMIFRPFKVGDVIEAKGYLGTVKSINIFTTHLNTPDKKVIILPNGDLSTSSLTNFSTEPLRRVDWTFGIAYGDDMENFKKAINDFISEDNRIRQEPAPFIALSGLADSSVNFTVRVWVESQDYWSVFFDMNEKVYKRFVDYNLNIPFPQMDIHIKQK